MAGNSRATGQEPHFELEHFREDIPAAVDYCTKLIVHMDPVTQAVLDFARPRYGERIADIGTGLGWLPVKLSLCGYDNISGVDISKDRIEAAKLLASRMGRRVDFQVGTTESLPAESFDLALSTCYLHHFTEISFPVAEIHRILKPNGRCFIYEPNGLWAFAGYKIDRQLRAHPSDGTGNETLFSCLALSRALRLAGFQIEFLSTNWYWSGLTKLMCHLPLKHLGRSIIALATKGSTDEGAADCSTR